MTEVKSTPKNDMTDIRKNAVQIKIIPCSWRKRTAFWLSFFPVFHFFFLQSAAPSFKNSSSKTRYLTLFNFLLIFIFLSKQAQASPCPYPEKEPFVKAILQAAEPIYYNHLSSKDFHLFALQNRFELYSNNPELYHQEGTMHGLTLSKMEEKTFLQTVLVPVKGGFCLYPVSLTLTVGFSKMAVLIDSRYAPDSCPYKAIMEHENEHVKTNYYTLRFYLPFIRDAYQKALLKIKPAFFATPLQQKTATEHMMEFLQKQTRPIFNFFNQVQRQENQKLDTQESYLRTQLLCPVSDW